MEVFSLTRAALDGEVWRLWSGHLVHYDLGHLAFNVLAALPPLFLLSLAARRVLLAQLVVIAPLLSLLLLQIGGFSELRGASGLIVAAWCGAGFMLIAQHRRLEGLLLLAAIATKLLLDRHELMPLGSSAFVVSTAAHAGGALLALLFAPLMRVPMERGASAGDDDEELSYFAFLAGDASS